MNTNDNGRDARFDAAMRQLHATAVDRVSGRTRLQLQQAPRPTPSARGRRPLGWPLGASFAALLALMVGVQLWNAPEPMPSGQPDGSAVATVSDTTDDIDTVLDENPDLYLWLASNDAYALAME